MIVVNATFQVPMPSSFCHAELPWLRVAAACRHLGGMLTNGINYLYDGYWWEIYPAGLIIVLTVIAFNFIGDGLRDALQVRLQRR